MEHYRIKQFHVADKRISVCTCAKTTKPVIYLNTFGDSGEQIYKALLSEHCPDFSLVAVSGLDQNSDLTPWEIPPIFRNALPYIGDADNYLELLTQKIVPLAEQEIGAVSWRGIAGYSLAGLFAFYSVYQTDLFARAASISGSLWYPNFKEYAQSHEMKRLPERLYISLGDKEGKTRNPFLKNVQQDTEELVRYCQNKGIDTIFEQNEGNHFSNPVERTAMSLLRLLEKQ